MYKIFILTQHDRISKGSVGVSVNMNYLEHIEIFFSVDISENDQYSSFKLANIENMGLPTDQLVF